MRADADRRPAGGAGGAFQHCGFFAFRVPALPMSVMTGWGGGMKAPTAAPEELEAALEHDRALLRQRLEEVVGRPDVQDALAVASPDLLDGLRQRGEDPGVEAALVRYVSRMSTRPTPYGMFAACGVGVIGERTRVDLPDRATWRLHTQLDADFLDALIRDASERFRNRLAFRPNDSLHLMGGRWRYVESHLDGLERSYRLLQAADSKHLQRALEAAQDGATPDEVAKAVTSAGVDVERAARYVGQLIDAQVLVPTVAITLTGDPPLDALIADLESLGDDHAVAVLSAVREALAAPAIDYERITTELAGLAPLDRSRLFHAQLAVPSCDATLGRSAVDHIVRGIGLLQRVSPPIRDTELDAFRDAFRDRYESQEVPLLEALDEELGVGFGGDADPVPLLEGLRFPTAAGADVTLGGRELRLLEILRRAWRDGTHEVALTAEDIDALEVDDAAPLPAAVGATAVLARTADGPQVVVTGASGPSGARLLGRFCHSDPELERHVRAHLRAEEALDPDAIHAEIVHLPTGRLVNVLARPVLRDYEIEWLGRSGAPSDRVLPAGDLLLSLRDERFVLRSRTLGRRVLPRLTSAHNYSRHSPGVYRFLAAVQADGRTESVGWSWFPFDRAPFTPRLRRGPIVLALARWRITGAELRALDQPDGGARWQAVAALRERLRLPRWIRLVEGDNVLAFDLDNALSVDTFVRAVRRREEVVLEELFPGPDELVASGPDGGRAIELVIPLVRTTPVPAPALDTPSAPIRRTFPPGTEWTYLKLYTGSATADRLLVEEVGPCARGLVGSGAADSWFFLRYEDRGFHLRIRAHGDADRVRTAFEALVARAIDEGLAHDAMLGTYVREVERYGGADGIVVAEQLFHADSDAVVDLLDMFDPGEAGLDARWRIGLLGADRLLRDLGLDEAARAAAARSTRTAFEQEFKADGRLRKDVAARVRAEHAALDELLDVSADSDHPLGPGVAVLDERSARIAPLVEALAGSQLTTPVHRLATSFVHMWLNRLCRSKSRRQEYVVYALLARLYEARSARAP